MKSLLSLILYLWGIVGIGIGVVAGILYPAIGVGIRIGTRILREAMRYTISQDRHDSSFFA